MGFPIPIFFAWLAVLSEFIGGILLMLGLFTRPAAFMNVSVTFIATFLYHKGDISGSALLSFFFMIMCICILLYGPGKFSLDYLIHGRQLKKIVTTSTIVIFLLSSNFVMAKAGSHSLQIKSIISANSKDSSGVIFYLQNNRLLPKKFTFIIYNPNETGNNTRVKWFFPFQKIKLQLPIDTKIYIATEPQINIVMQGNRIDQDIPFLIVNEKSKNKILKLNNQKSKPD